VRPAPPSVERDPLRDKELTLAQTLVALGYRQIIANSMVDPHEGARFSEAAPVVLENPLSQEASVMRTTAVPGMLRALRWNLDRGQVDLRLFEAGKTYNASRDPATGLPRESRVLTLAMTGHRRPASWHEQEKPGLVDIFDLKGDLENLLGAFDTGAVGFEPSSTSFFEPGLCGTLTGDGGTLATVGKISTEVLRDYKLRQDVWVAEVDLERLYSLPLRTLQFKPFSKFPAVERDFSLLVPEAIDYRRIERVILDLALGDVQDFRPVDRLPVGKIVPSHWSVLLRVTFQRQTQTLTSEEVDELSKRVLKSLEPLGIRLRS